MKLPPQQDFADYRLIFGKPITQARENTD